MSVVRRSDTEERWTGEQLVRPCIGDLPLLPVEDFTGLSVYGDAQGIRCPFRTLCYGVRSIVICRNHGNTMPRRRMPQRQTR